MAGCLRNLLKHMQRHEARIAACCLGGVLLCCMRQSPAVLRCAVLCLGPHPHRCIKSRPTMSIWNSLQGKKSEAGKQAGRQLSTTQAMRRAVRNRGRLLSCCG